MSEKKLDSVFLRFTSIFKHKWQIRILYAQMGDIITRPNKLLRMAKRTAC